MKKILAMLIVAVAFVAIANVDLDNDVEDTLVHCHREDAIVTDVNKQLVTIEREDGHIFTFVGNGYNVGDLVNVVFDTKNTPFDVADDTVFSASRYANL